MSVGMSLMTHDTLWTMRRLTPIDQALCVDLLQREGGSLVSRQLQLACRVDVGHSRPSRKPYADGSSKPVTNALLEETEKAVNTLAMQRARGMT